MRNGRGEREIFSLFVGAVADVFGLVAITAGVTGVEQALKGALYVGVADGAATESFAAALGKHHDRAHSEQDDAVLEHFFRRK